MFINLRDMKVGDWGRVTSYDQNLLPYRQKLLAMGLTPGTEFKVIRVAPLGDPIEIRMRGTDLCLRQDMAAGLNIMPLESMAEAEKFASQLAEYTIAVIGNPNSGKTTLFNSLTGARQHVGNWAGVTVERKTGFYRYCNKAVEVVDLPGIYTLDVNEKLTSLDEKIARDYILSQKADLIINIVDTSHLERNLYLTTQLLEMHLPMLVVLNNMDDATGCDLKIDSDEIARRLECPLVSLVATRADDTRKLKSSIDRLAEHNILADFAISYPTAIQAALESLTPLVEQQQLEKRVGDARWFALKILEQDDFALGQADTALTETAAQLRRAIEVELGDQIDIAIADSRYGFINLLVQETLQRQSEIGRDLSDKIDSVVLHRIFGIPIFFGMMYLMFTFTIKLGRAFKPFFNDLAQALFVDGIAHGLALLDSPSWLIMLAAQGVGNGIREVAAFIPILGFLYLFISVLEESGYMARATFAMDRLMRGLGLPGKAFVPMILGFGCNVPAMLATRTLEQPRDRLLSILLNPFMTCGARLAVFTLFASIFFPDNGEMIVFVLYLIGVMFAVLTALLLKHTFLKEAFSLVLMEIPNYHVPKLKNVLINTWTRVETFVMRVGKIIISMVLILNILSSLGTDGSFHTNNIQHSVLSAVGRAVTPALTPMGIDEDNWPTTVALFTGILHKVVAISTLKTIYAESDQAKSNHQAAAFDLGDAVKQAFMTIPMGLKKMLGIASVTQSAGQDHFAAALQTHFHGQIGAFAYLLFMLLYFPCIATSAAAYRESSLRWSVFMVLWATGLAYLTATLFYQLATFSQHPLSSSSWLLGIIAIACTVVLVFRYWGKRRSSDI